MMNEEDTKLESIYTLGFDMNLSRQDETNNTYVNPQINRFIQRYVPTLKTFTPTVTSGTGTITTATGSIRYYYIGNIAISFINITVTTNGTGATYINVTLPFTPKNVVSASGRNNVTNVSVNGYTSSNNLRVVKYDGTYPAASGDTFYLTLICER